MVTKMSVGTLEEADLKGKRVLLPADLVPLDEAQKNTGYTRNVVMEATMRLKFRDGCVLKCKLILCFTQQCLPSNLKGHHI
ncbi:phosphoglycerate kinase 3, cytosolic-like [Phragmites australis]|uniref:phosphoglycerate kinase 3, cytosolic-like n=1 Tax=Phragmites australis TaxID=29695 RepID=UPI002D79F933|nr:phosphoglycerate kinase 3, cytosolic-like [Phragmites australis]